MTEHAEPETEQQEPPFRLPDFQVTFRDCADQETAERIAPIVNGYARGLWCRRRDVSNDHARWHHKDPRRDGGLVRARLNWRQR